MFARLFTNPAVMLSGVTAVNLAASSLIHKNQKVDAQTLPCPDCKDQKKEVSDYQSTRPTRF